LKRESHQGFRQIWWPDLYPCSGIPNQSRCDSIPRRSSTSRRIAIFRRRFCCGKPIATNGTAGRKNDESDQDVAQFFSENFGLKGVLQPRLFLSVRLAPRGPPHLAHHRRDAACSGRYMDRYNEHQPHQGQRLNVRAPAHAFRLWLNRRTPNGINEPEKLLKHAA
jgi:hypothetical protein